MRGFSSSITSEQSELKNSFPSQQSHGVSCCQGKLKNNEDRYDIIKKLVPGFSYFAVFDGHRGHFGADFLRNELSGILAKNIFPDESLAAQGKELVENSFETCEHLLEVEILANDFEKKERDHIGTTALTALISEKSELLIGQTGDSHAILCRAGSPLALVDDHTPNNENEVTRIEKEGGWIDWDTKLVPYVNGVLSMTRSFGNILLRKSGVTHTPCHRLVELDADNDQFLVLCTDGVSNWITDEEIVEIVLQHSDAQESADALTCCARQYGSTDDATAIVVTLNAWNKRVSGDRKIERNFLRANILKRD
eukprot:gene8627-14639_t